MHMPKTKYKREKAYKFYLIGQIVIESYSFHLLTEPLNPRAVCSDMKKFSATLHTTGGNVFSLILDSQ